MRALLSMLLLLSLLCGCGRDTKPVVGVIPKGASHQFWQTVHAGAVAAGEEYGLAVEWNAPALEIDRARQIDIVQSMVTRKLAGIAIAPVDKQALVAVLERAAAAGVPVAVYDSDVDTAKRITYVATDNRAGGRLAAQRVAEAIGGKGKVGVVGFMPGSASTMEREEGFLSEMKEKHPAVEVLGVMFGMADRAKAMAVTENLLSSHADLRGLFADNESSLAGAVQALKARGRKEVKLVGFDASEQLAADLREGWIDALVLQDPFRMGYESVKAIGEFRKGAKVAERQELKARLIQRGDLEDAKVKELLFPDLGKWLKGR
jgi:ribose transport system substrate-binding protein